MRRLFAALILVVACGAAPALASDQTIVVTPGPNGQIVRTVGRYVAGPIHVSVLAPRASAAQVAGSDADGANVQVPLARTARGWEGDVRLDAGTWHLTTFVTEAGTTTQGAPFPLNVGGTDTTPVATLFGALAVLSIGGGIGLIAAGRRVSDSAVP